MRDPRTDPQPGDTLAGFNMDSGAPFMVSVHFLHEGYVHYGHWALKDGDEKEPESSQCRRISIALWIEQAPAGTVISVGREKVAA